MDNAVIPLLTLVLAAVDLVVVPLLLSKQRALDRPRDRGWESNTARRGDIEVAGMGSCVRPAS